MVHGWEGEERVGGSGSGMEGGGGGCWSWMRVNFGQRSREQDGSERKGRSCTRVINACVVCRLGSSGPAKQADTLGIFCS